MLDYESRDPCERLTPDGMDSEVFPRGRVSQKSFYPVNLLKELVCEKVVASILRNYNIKINRDDLIRFICDHAKRIFVILASQERIELITYFFEHKCTDEMLPVQRTVDPKVVESFHERYTRLGTVQKTFQHLGRGASTLMIKNFSWAQW
jgi:hypothetical protein